MSWDFKFGIEEEYFVNDAPKRDIAKGKIREFFTSCRENISGDIQPEMLEPQIEIATKPSLEFSEARTQLASLRSSVGAVARDFNLSIMASGTHPLAVWSRVRPTPCTGRRPRGSTPLSYGSARTSRLVAAHRRELSNEAHPRRRRSDRRRRNGAGPATR